MSKSSPWFALSSYEDTKSFFEFPVDYVVNNTGYRDVLIRACESRYVKAMLSPRYWLNGTHNVYSVSSAQIPPEALRKELLNGYGLAHRTFGDDFINIVLDLFGVLIGSYLLAETYNSVNEAFYKRSLVHATDLEKSRPYDFRPYYLATFTGVLELNYPPCLSHYMAPTLFATMRLPLGEVEQLSERVRRTTGRPVISFTFH